jgi:hypothetical protein
MTYITYFLLVYTCIPLHETLQVNIITLVIGPSILVYILIENQQRHQSDHFIVMSIKTLLHVSAY